MGWFRARSLVRTSLVSDPYPRSEPSEHGEWLEWDTYRREFQARRAQLRNFDYWKFERGQHFEQHSPGWDAVDCNAADWDAVACDAADRDAADRDNIDWGEAASMTLIERKRAWVQRCVAADRADGRGFYRVRVVAEPLSRCMKSELRLLRMQAECGMGVRVVPAEPLSGLESRAVLPEIVVLGKRTLYEIVHSDSGVPIGAYRRAEAESIRNWTEFLMQLYAIGEDVRTYVDRNFPDPTSAPE